MTMRLAAPITLLCCVLLAFACGGDPERALPSYDDANPLPLEGALLYLDHRDEDTPHALIVDISRARPQLRAHALPAGPSSGQTLPGRGGHKVVVLTAGRDARIEDGVGQDAVSSYVVLFDRNGERWRKELPGRFQRLALAGDGSFAVAYAPAAGVALADAVAVVDLRDAERPARNVRLSDASGQPITSFVFSDSAAEGRQLLLALGLNRLQVVDLERLGDPPKGVELKLPGDARQLTVGRVIFRADEIFVHVVGSSDVLLLQLVPTDDGDFTLAPLQLATGSLVRDIALVEENGTAQVVALGQGAITLLEPITGRGVSSTLGGGFTDILPFRASSPLDDQERARALLVQRDGSQIAFVDFDDGSAWAQQSVEVFGLDDSVTRFVPVLDLKLAVLVYATGGLALVDLEQRTISPVETHSAVTGSLLDEGDGRARLWLMLEDGRIGHVDLLALEASEVLLNAPAANLLVVEGEKRRIAAIHDAEAGYVTLLDPAAPTRESARELAGFLYSQIFD